MGNGHFKTLQAWGTPLCSTLWTVVAPPSGKAPREAGILNLSQ